MVIELKPTQRGFLRGEFRDANGKACSIQESSVATEAMLWLGVDGPVADGLSARMHLTQDMAAELIPLLQLFVETGEL